MTMRKGGTGENVFFTWGPMAVLGRQRDERRLKMAFRVTS